ncbi:MULTISPECIES: methyltransferase domain-containing protein [Psychrilyobacter]|uniref:Arsenite methyltransferase n=1 Tax=Psychrilyobacter piezotolerans TaxID=2293438 RepID=A0ABX9KH25_9FUSO|nr:MULTISPECIES: methyltransferase domain-containing protein [Psychrilyobacter]MCS5421156.1 methyltransferase domain-containing protein [Psychrilyobacter sp. S5]NDI77929.1 methyltransferase domain-containing protein [Psychrilyobacter piezotolerans]RDE62045.1 methyltransferase domain-containing protein [Psychrilyobacter sp. S5]REI41292.1 methyltransferase domain-containing protein [Psychrilyobacter piezotolerans]
MKDFFSIDDRVRIQKDIEKKYSKVAINPAGQFRYTTGRKALEFLKYDRNIMEQLPEMVADAYCGTGNPFLLGEIKDGEIILDFGCGAGIDLIFASKLVGDQGRVVGLDLIPEMLGRAKKNIDKLNLKNTSLVLSKDDNLIFPDATFDTIISNSVFNLVPNKEFLFKELYRVLKPKGKLMVVDQLFTGGKIKDHRDRVDSWFQ